MKSVIPSAPKTSTFSSTMASTESSSCSVKSSLVSRVLGVELLPLNIFFKSTIKSSLAVYIFQFQFSPHNCRQSIPPHLKLSIPSFLRPSLSRNNGWKNPKRRQKEHRRPSRLAWWRRPRYPSDAGRNCCPLVDLPVQAVAKDDFFLRSGEL